MVVAAVTVLILIGALAGVALLNDSDGSSAAMHRVQPAVQASAVELSHADIDAIVTPVTPSDFEHSTQRLMDFVRQVQFSASSQCFRANGHPELIGEAPPSDVGQTQNFEDPATLRTVAFGVTTSHGPTLEEVRQQEQQASSPDAQRCVGLDIADLARLEQLEGPILGAWLNEVRTVDGSPQLEPAWATWSVCMSQHGYATPNQDAVYALADAQIQAAGAAAHDVEFAIAAADADCLDGGVTQARTDARTSARAELLASHDSQAQALYDELPQLITSLEVAYDVQY